MQIIVLANESVKEELLSNSVQPKAELIWISDAEDFLSYSHAVACIDLLFEKNEERMNILKQVAGLVIINSVVYTLKETHPAFVRINAWNGFLQSSLVEAASSDENKQMTEDVFSQFNKKIEWLPDEPGFVTPRIISMILNEAYISLEEGVSTKEQINKAMKLGTNYPYGPFEWAEKIGQKNLASLLHQLSAKDQSYSPSSLLIQQIS
jgi:3-hydroxybutyryl-CoA dehydrogenase